VGTEIVMEPGRMQRDWGAAAGVWAATLGQVPKAAKWCWVLRKLLRSARLTSDTIPPHSRAMMWHTQWWAAEDKRV